MLETPVVLMLNCVGSYFYSILNHLSLHNDNNMALFYLSKGCLAFRELSLDEVFLKYGTNSWGYQPVVLVDANHTPLEINNEFFNYLEKNLNITVTLLDTNNWSLSECLKLVDNIRTFLICTVDEHYLTYSKFYKKTHNKHFVLIKNINPRSLCVELIDSESNRTHQVSYDELQGAIYNSIYKKKSIYLVDGNKYVKEPINTQLNKIQLTPNNSYLTELMQDIESKKSDGSLYFYQGYYYNIVSKIIPYYQMCSSFSINNNGKYFELLTEWKNLSKYMRLKIFQEDINYSKVIDKLGVILNIENSV